MQLSDCCAYFEMHKPRVISKTNGKLQHATMF